MNADNATPRPWSVNDWPQRDADIRIGAAGTPLIATVHLRDTSINGQRANTALIIRAVNSYDAMRAALRPFAALLSAHHADMPDNRPVFGINDALFTVGDLHAARAALALADQEPQT